jgi:hypothetical protein
MSRRLWYDRDEQWQEKNQPNNEELSPFHREAEKVLVLKK